MGKYLNNKWWNWGMFAFCTAFLIFDYVNELWWGVMIMAFLCGVNITMATIVQWWRDVANGWRKVAEMYTNRKFGNGR